MENNERRNEKAIGKYQTATAQNTNEYRQGKARGKKADLIYASKIYSLYGQYLMLDILRDCPHMNDRLRI